MSFRKAASALVGVRSPILFLQIKNKSSAGPRMTELDCLGRLESPISCKPKEMKIKPKSLILLCKWQTDIIPCLAIAINS